MGKFFDTSTKELKKATKIANVIVSKEEEYKALTDEQLQSKTQELRNRLNNGESLNDILVDAFATVREGATRVLGMTPFKVQILGAIALHGGNIAEMKTGEGKTLTSTMAAYLNALPQQGVHIVTVNEYLASRDCEEMGQLFTWLGLTVGLNLRELTPEQKQEAYKCDIMYTTNNEIGFDYLRDNMAVYRHKRVQRKLNYCIIDEVDSILIDESRTPLIISGGTKKTKQLYDVADKFVKSLKSDDFEIDEKYKNVQLTEVGIKKAERSFNLDNIYDLTHVSLVHRINQSLKANYGMERNVEYVVQDGDILIVDSFTGRIMKGRQYSDGLHQALQAKESCDIKEETSTLATITYQNFFRMYAKLSGMTGTAKTEEEEFLEIYNMFVVEIPTNKPVVRVDAKDIIFANMQTKFVCLAEDIKERNAKGQPVLVGTNSIEASELVSKLLTKHGVKHELLNAKQHEREGHIVENAGQIGAVTIATNMAGRGTDIKLAPGVKELGGLAIIGTERNESRRIDDQLRGRSGRQGDPGYSVFYLSGDDDLVRRFGADTFKKNIERIAKLQGDKNPNAPVTSRTLQRVIKNSQRLIEGHNFDRRKNVLKYDQVMRKQRELIYKQRSDILDSEDLQEILYKMSNKALGKMISDYYKNEGFESEKFTNAINNTLFPHSHIDSSEVQDLQFSDVFDFVFEKYKNEIDRKQETLPPEIMQEFLKSVMLKVIDTKWINHLSEMRALRQSITLQSIGQQNPLREYTSLGFEKFESLIASIQQDICIFACRTQVKLNVQREQVAKPIATNDSKALPKKSAVSSKVSRNSSCPCGSGKKYKQCCGQ